MSPIVWSDVNITLNFEYLSNNTSCNRINGDPRGIWFYVVVVFVGFFLTSF